MLYVNNNILCGEPSTQFPLMELFVYCINGIKDSQYVAFCIIIWDSISGGLEDVWSNFFSRQEVWAQNPVTDVNICFYNIGSCSQKKSCLFDFQHNPVCTNQCVMISKLNCTDSQIRLQLICERSQLIKNGISNCFVLKKNNTCFCVISF